MQVSRSSPSRIPRWFARLSLLALPLVAGFATEAAAASSGAETIARARRSLAAGRPAEALTLLAPLGKARGRDRRTRSQACLLRARACLKLGKRSRAVQWLRLALDSHPENHAAADLLVWLEAGDDRLEARARLRNEVRDALDALDEILSEASTQSEDVRRVLASSRAVFQRGLKGRRTRALSRLGLGRVTSLGGGSDDLALRYFRDALALTKQNPQIYLALARHHERRGRPAEALRTLNQAYDAGHRDGETCFRLALALGGRAGKGDEARAMECVRIVSAADVEAGERLVASFRRPHWRELAEEILAAAEEDERVFQATVAITQEEATRGALAASEPTTDEVSQGQAGADGRVPAAGVKPAEGVELIKGKAR